MGGLSRRTRQKKRDPTWKIPKAKKGSSHRAPHLPSKCKTLSLTPEFQKKIKQNKEPKPKHSNRIIQHHQPYRYVVCSAVHSTTLRRPPTVPGLTLCCCPCEVLIFKQRTSCFYFVLGHTIYVAKPVSSPKVRTSLNSTLPVYYITPLWNVHIFTAMCVQIHKHTYILEPIPYRFIEFHW
jgi:hypothetical protein